MKSTFPFSLIAMMVFLSCQSSDQTTDHRRPNILFAFADDMGKYASCYAQVDGPNSINTLIQTPNIDRIARDGILFKNAFVNAPSCTPCRSSLLSGQHFYRTGLGAILQGAIWNDSIPTYPLLLEEAGYHIGYTYKVWSPGTPRDAGYGGIENRYQRAAKFNRFSQNVTLQMEEDGFDLETAKDSLYKEVADNFSDFLAARTADEPFCYWWGPTNVHRKWTYGSGKKMWSIEPDSLRGKMPGFLPDVDTVRTDFADYLGEIMAFDAGLGIILELLEAAGELDNTLIVVSGDHGFPGMSNGKCNLYDFGIQVPLVCRWPGVISPGRIVDDFVSIPDLAPTFLQAAGLSGQSQMTAKSLVPIFKSQSQGQIDPSRNFVIAGRERHVKLARAGALPYPQRAIRTDSFLFILNFEPDRYPMGDPMGIEEASMIDMDELTNNTFYAFGDYDGSPSKAWIVAHREEDQYEQFYQFAFGKRPREELFDIHADPDQINNLAANPKYKAIKQKLSSRLINELKATGDPRVLVEEVPFESAPYAGQ